MSEKFPYCQGFQGSTSGDSQVSVLVVSSCRPVTHIDYRAITQVVSSISLALKPGGVTSLTSLHCFWPVMVA